MVIITMPHMTGIELAKEILRIRPDMPIILCTGYSDKISRETVLEIGIRDLIIKPLAIRELVELVRDVLDQSERLVA